MVRRPIQIDELDKFSVEENDYSLYWNDKRVKLESRLTLTTAQKWVAILVAVATISMGVTDFWRFACDAGWWSLSCPLHP